ncbi:MAG TPA: polyamine aminopropyltransferase [Sunxiuqinia sp.]|nr:polyamine aminopropyltransferase [Sunxiuqinia sp.]
MILKNKSILLKATIFATGFSGVVAEYILSTLATYFLGDSIFQWIMIISLMLFSMGIGSRISKSFEKQLLKRFLIIEFVLSILVGFSPLLVYTVTVWTSGVALLIYFLAILIGILIGMEIPLVVRVNESYESLRYNISNVLENDYYGSLLGGVFFAFIGLPKLGLTYTPFVLGMVNFSAALVLFIVLRDIFSKKDFRLISIAGTIVLLALVVGITIARPVILYGEQVKYKDKVVFTEQSQYQRIVITKWKNDYWLYLNGNEQLCTRDEAMYHEPLVHPAMSLHPHPENILIVGGGDGCAAREVLKYKTVKTVKLVDLDPAMTKLAETNEILTKLNRNSLSDHRVHVINEDGYKYLQSDSDYYDVILVDLPDPRSVELGRLYSYEFYKTCYRRLRPGGVIVTQSGSPYFATRAFLCINKTMQVAGFTVQPLHNQVITLGEWGWNLGQKQCPHASLKKALQALHFQSVKTKWINNEAMQLMTSFGKDIYPWKKDTVEINRIHHPVLYKYYLQGNWDLY